MEFKKNRLKFENFSIENNYNLFKNEGGYIWATQNYDAEIASDIVSLGFGVKGLMTSILIGKNDVCLVEDPQCLVNNNMKGYMIV